MTDEYRSNTAELVNWKKKTNKQGNDPETMVSGIERWKVQERTRDEKDEYVCHSSSGEENGNNEVEVIIQGIWLRISQNW